MSLGSYLAVNSMTPVSNSFSLNCRVVFSVSGNTSLSHTGVIFTILFPSSGFFVLIP